jgi:hypothetical protein
VLSTLASNQSMKPTAHCETTSACLPRHPAVAYLHLVRSHRRGASYDHYWDIRSLPRGDRKIVALR